MNRALKMVVTAVLISISINLTGCMMKKNSDEKNKLAIYLDVEDTNSLKIIQYAVDKYKEEKKDLEVEIINPIDKEKIKEDISQKSAGDLIVTSRNRLIELGKAGLISDFNEFNKNNDVSEKFYNIVTAYGVVGEKYYGVAPFVSTIEIFYNKAALQKLNIKEPKSMTDVLEVLKKIKEKKISIPVALSDDVDMYNGLASFIFNNVSDIAEIEEKYNTGMNGYLELNSMQKIFNDVYYLVKEKYIDSETFKFTDKKIVSKLLNGDTPIIVATSDIIKDIESGLKDESVGIVEDYNISNVRENTPVIASSLFCVPRNAKNESGAYEFMKFLLSDDIQKGLSEEGIITGYRDIETDSSEGNTQIASMKNIVSKHLENANYNSILYIYNFPKEFQAKMESKFTSVLAGKYTAKEWEEILREIYPQ